MAVAQQQPVQLLRMQSAHRWELDVKVVTTKELTTTGGTVWSAATRCREFLEVMAAELGLMQPGVRVSTCLH